MPGQDRDSILRFFDDVALPDGALPQQLFIGPRLASQSNRASNEDSNVDVVM